MGYPTDLDTLPIADIRAEIERRRKAVAEGKCPYCGYHEPTHPAHGCRFADTANRPAGCTKEYYDQAEEA